MKVKVDAAPAGAALDRIVALTQGLHEGDDGTWRNSQDRFVHPPIRGGRAGQPIWCPSGNIGAAFDLLPPDKMIGFDSILKKWIVWHIVSYDGPTEFTEADTAPLAIVRAFLKARGITEIEAEW